MSILSFKGDTIAKLQAALSKNQATADRLRTDRADTTAALADVETRLASAMLEDDSSAAALSVERTNLAGHIVALDLALRKSDADADALRQQISAATDRGERERVAKLLEGQAVELERALLPARKAFAALAQAYAASSHHAVEATPAATPRILGHGFEWISSFMQGDAVDCLVTSLRQKAADVIEGRVDPATVATSVRGRSEAWFGKAKAAS